MKSTIINGGALETLMMLDDNSVHCCITSPPYYGLRNYGTGGQVWGGDPNCKHNWALKPIIRKGSTNGRELSTLVSVGSDKTIGPGNINTIGDTKQFRSDDSYTCDICGAWKGELGLEPTPELYVQHLVEIFRELRRVLRNDGTFWLNIGDSYAANRTYQVTDNKWEDVGNNHGSKVPEGLKPKDLIGIPWMLAFALRADGWYLRADLPWIKRNAMPSSVRDRPSSSIEHVFLFSKSAKYYYDYVATMQPSSDSYNKDKRPRGIIRQCVNQNSKYPDKGQFKKQDAVGNNTYTGFNDRYEPNGIGLRYMRDSDFFFKTWQGLLHNENGEPMALIVNPRGYKGAHFACFPVQLVEPMILVSTSEKGVCPICGNPWIRDTLSSVVGSKPQSRGDSSMDIAGDPMYRGGTHNEGLKTNYVKEIDTIGWHPSCSCRVAPVSTEMGGIPATVLDPFSGSCATGVACQWHNRDFIGIDLKKDYCDLGKTRLESNK